jgi:hypothetical protein
LKPLPSKPPRSLIISPVILKGAVSKLRSLEARINPKSI